MLRCDLAQFAIPKGPNDEEIRDGGGGRREIQVAEWCSDGSNLWSPPSFKAKDKDSPIVGALEALTRYLRGFSEPFVLWSARANPLQRPC
ncbi:unnamed protein product [Urochloa humidicola]